MFVFEVEFVKDGVCVSTDVELEDDLFFALAKSKVFAVVDNKWLESAFGTIRLL